MYYREDFKKSRDGVPCCAFKIKEREIRIPADRHEIIYLIMS